jgi:hypothetical protein
MEVDETGGVLPKPYATGSELRRLCVRAALAAAAVLFLLPAGCATRADPPAATRPVAAGWTRLEPVSRTLPSEAPEVLGILERARANPAAADVLNLAKQHLSDCNRRIVYLCVDVPAGYDAAKQRFTAPVDRLAPTDLEVHVACFGFAGGKVRMVSNLLAPRAAHLVGVTIKNAPDPDNYYCEAAEPADGDREDFELWRETLFAPGRGWQAGATSAAHSTIYCVVTWDKKDASVDVSVNAAVLRDTTKPSDRLFEERLTALHELHGWVWASRGPR